MIFNHWKSYCQGESNSAMISFNPRRVTMDTSVLVAHIISKRDSSVVRSVILKSKTDDELIITNIIRDEVLAYADKPDSRATRYELERGLEDLGVPIYDLGEPPSASELQERYGIRDIDDSKILYSVETTDSVILVTYDDDYFDEGIHGLDLEIMDPLFYLYEEDIKSGKYVPERPRNRRHLVVKKH